MNQRVLLVEAPTGLASFRQVRLANAGYTVELVTTASATLSAAQVFEPDLVILDVDLFERDGIAVARRLQAASQAPLLLLVPNSNIVVPSDDAPNRVVDYLTKPISDAALLSGVNQRLRPHGRP